MYALKATGWISSIGDHFSFSQNPFLGDEYFGAYDIEGLFERGASEKNMVHPLLLPNEECVSQSTERDTERER